MRYLQVTENQSESFTDKENFSQKIGNEKKKKKERPPPLPSEHRGWNAGKGDCGHYRSQLGFSILMGRGFMPRTLPVAFTTNLAPALIYGRVGLFIGLNWIGEKSIWVS